MNIVSAWRCFVQHLPYLALLSLPTLPTMGCCGLFLCTNIYIYIFIKYVIYIYIIVSQLMEIWKRKRLYTIFAAKTAIHIFVYFLFCNVHLGQCDSEWAVQVRLWWGLALEFLWCDNCCFATWPAMKLRGPITCDLSASTHFVVCLIGSLRRSPVQHIHQKEMLSSEMH